jgi:hypothetical protein
MRNNTTGSYTDTGLINGTTYYYVVRAYDGTNESANSIQASAFPLDNKAPVISNLTSTNILTDTATINWTTDEPSDSRIEYGTSLSYGQVSPLNGSLVINHSAILSSLSAGTDYYYRVNSHDAGGNNATATGVFTTKTTGLNVIFPDGAFKGNGVPDITDALKALRIAVGLVIPSADDMLHGDVAPLVNGVPAPDGKIDVADAPLILKKVVGLINF